MLSTVVVAISTLLLAVLGGVLVEPPAQQQRPFQPGTGSTDWTTRTVSGASRPRT
jgi:hypothetical protein